MLLIPLPFIATALLMLVALRLAGRARAIWMFVVLVTLYAVQSAMIGVRWGYDVPALTPALQALAPVLPGTAWLAFVQMGRRLVWRDLWHAAVPVAAWAGLLAGTDLADAIGVVASLVYGAGLLWLGLRDRLQFGAARVDAGDTVRRALMLTGVILIGAALTDVFIVVDFIRTGGQSLGIAVSTSQVVALCLVALAAALAGDGVPRGQTPEPVRADQVTTPDTETAKAVDALFDGTDLHTDMDLSLRKVARKLGVPDRTVSRAINGTYGQTFKQYVNQRRVADAQRLLVETDLSIIDVGLEAGFLTKSNFNRTFLEVTGQSPSAYRLSATG